MIEARSAQDVRRAFQQERVKYQDVVISHESETGMYVVHEPSGKWGKYSTIDKAIARVHQIHSKRKKLDVPVWILDGQTLKEARITSMNRNGEFNVSVTPKWQGDRDVRKFSPSEAKRNLLERTEDNYLRAVVIAEQLRIEQSARSARYAQEKGLEYVNLEAVFAEEDDDNGGD